MCILCNTTPVTVNTKMFLSVDDYKGVIILQYTVLYRDSQNQSKVCQHVNVNQLELLTGGDGGGGWWGWYLWGGRGTGDQGCSNMLKN